MFSDVIEKMKTCMQTDTQSVYEHGISVRNYAFDLLNHLRHGTDLKFEWTIPQWVYDNKDFILDNIVNDESLKLYTELHDIGKPFCLEIDDEGRRHYPNHAEVSYDIFKKYFDNEEVAQLIKRDMDFHLLKSDGLEEFSKFENVCTLLIVSLAEVHSNAALFGGMDSISFKIKWKHCNKRGRQVINLVRNK